MVSFGAWALCDLLVAGPDPFGSEGLANAEAVERATLTLLPQARAQRVQLIEADDSGAGETGALPRFAGLAAAEGPIESEYGYAIRPLASQDPADNLSLYVLEVAGVAVAVAASAPLQPGETYRIAGVLGEDARVPYAAQAVCFAAGTLLATRRGPMPVESLQPGDRLQTSDNGYRRLRWVGRWRVGGMGGSAPVRIAAGVLGNDRALEVSGQHRLLIRPEAGPLAGEEVLVAAHCLVGLPGFARAPRPRVEWVHLLLGGHELIFAENCRAETLLPGALAAAVMEPMQAHALRARLREEALLGLPIRPIVPPGRAAALIVAPVSGRRAQRVSA